MACSNLTLKGLVNQCDSSRGGVKRVFIADRSTTITFNESEGVITGVTGGSWLQYYIRPNTSSFTSTATIDAANGVNYVETKLNLVFTKIDAVKRLEMNAYMYNHHRISTNAYHHITVLGKEEAVVATNATAESGTAKSDGNKYTLELTDTTSGFPLQLTEAAIEGLTTA